jgi:hypothetical protein
MKSEDEVITILRNNGIEVVMKPVAMFPQGVHNDDGTGGRIVSFIEIDIYDALSKLNGRASIARDPFSESKST